MTTNSASRESLVFRHPVIVAFVIGAILTLLAVWPMVIMVVPDRLFSLAKICTVFTMPGLAFAIAAAQNVHEYSPIVVSLGDFIFYSALAGFFIWLWRRRVR